MDTNHVYLISRIYIYIYIYISYNIYYNIYIYILTGNRVSLTMGLAGFRKLIHFDVLLGNAKCTILVLNMRWNKMRNLHSLNLIDQEPEVSTD